MSSRLLRHAPVMALVALAVPMPAPAQSPLLCGVLGPAARFKTVATGRLTTAWSKGYPYAMGYPIFSTDPPGEVCAQQISAGFKARWEDDIVATRDESIAIRFGVVVGKRPGYNTPYLGCYDYYPCNAHRVRGDIVTGGGRVVAFHDLFPQLDYGVIDTSGTHHLVSECQAAMAHLDVASAALAQGLLPGEPPEAVRTIIDLGNVRIGRDDHRILTPTGPGVTIYRIGDLTLENGPTYDYGYVPESATLELDSFAPNELIVVNVTGRVTVGRGGQIWGDPHAGLINVVGSGGSLIIRKWSRSDISILAPQRKIRMLARGGGSELYYGSAPALFGRDITLIGSASIGYYGYLGSLCGFPDD